MFPIKFVSNQVKYYKTVNEAFAAANPHMRSLLLNMNEMTLAPKKVGVFEALFTLVNKALNLQNTNKTLSKEMIEEALTLLKTKSSEESKNLLNIIELLKKYFNRGQIGEVLLKQKLQREGGQVLDEIKSLGLRI